MAESRSSEGKWLEGLRSEMPIQQAGRLVLQARLQPVLHWLEQFQQHPSDPEAIHQLRVSVRRSEAGLRLLRPCMRRKTYREARATLRTLRESVSATRDADVLILNIQKCLENASPSTRPGRELFLGFLLGRRSLLQQQPLPLLPSQLQQQAERWLDALNRGKASAKSLTFGPFARNALHEAFERLENALKADLSDEVALHAVRIAGKRLRYVIEIVGPSLDRSLVVEIYPQLENLQEILGLANDAHTAIGLLKLVRSSLSVLGSSGKEYRPGLASLLRLHRRQQLQQRRQFQQWLNQWQSQPKSSRM